MELWLLTALFLVAVAVFLHTLPYEFVYDDEYQVLRNPWIRDWSNLGRIFTTDVWSFRTPAAGSNFYRPLHMVLHMAGYLISGNRPYAYHAINLLLHGLCTVLVALVGFHLTRNRGLAAAGGLLFALHPVHAESVSWIAAVTDPSCAAFFFAALYLYLRDQQEPGNLSRIAGILVCYLGALLCKEMAFTLPLVAAAADWILLRRLRWSRYGMLLAVFAVYAALRIQALSGFLRQEVPFRLDLKDRVLTTLVYLSQYLAKLFVPYDLNPFHVFRPVTQFLAPEFLHALLILAGGALVLGWLRRQPAALFLGSFCVVSLLPTLNITGIGESVFAERYLYIPSLGSALIMPLIFRAAWLPLLARTGWAWERAGAGVLLLLTPLWGVMLWSTSTAWKDTPTLYGRTLARAPDAIPIRNSLARYYLLQGQYARAEELYLQVLDLWKKDFVQSNRSLWGAYGGLGTVYMKQRKLELARDYFTRVYEGAPNSFIALENMGSVYLALGDYKKALEFNQRALALNPRSEVIYSNTAAIYLNQRKLDDAIEMARKAVDIYPRLAEAHIILGKAYALKGDLGRAREAYATALRVDPGKAALVEADLKRLNALPPRR